MSFEWLGHFARVELECRLVKRARARGIDVVVVITHGALTALALARKGFCLERRFGCVSWKLEMNEMFAKV